MIGNVRSDLHDEHIHGFIRQQTDANFVYVCRYIQVVQTLSEVKFFFS